MEMHLGVSLEPTVFLGLVRIPVVQHDMNLSTGVVGYDFIHEIQQVPPATPGVVHGLDQSGGNLQGRQQSRRAMSFVAVTEPVDRLTVRQAQIAWGSLPSLHGR